MFTGNFPSADRRRREHPSMMRSQAPQLPPPQHFHQHRSPSSAGSPMSLSVNSFGGGNNSNANNASSSYCSSHFLQTTHAQIRRKQRNILYKDVKAAIKFGVRTPHIWSKDLKRMRQQQKKRKMHGPTKAGVQVHPQHSVYKYTYKDLIYIVDEKERKEITCYTKPVQLEPMPIPPSTGITQSSSSQNVPVLSHTVMIIDTSGSMKTSDVWGTRNRLDAVWMAIAIDFIAVRLQEQDRTGRLIGSDVVTIILMKERAQVLYRCVPLTWMLYNQFIHIYNQKQTIPPSGHGFFIPSLAIAEQIIDECNSIDNVNFTSSTVTSLLLLSDGVPSDPNKNHPRIMDHIDSITTKQVQIASPFLFTAIGIGGGGNDGKGNPKGNVNSNNNNTGGSEFTGKYPILRQMVETAQTSGATSAQLKVPSMSCTSFGQTFSSVATSISSTVTLQSSSSVVSPRQNSNFIRGGFRTISLRDDGIDDDEDDNENSNPQLVDDRGGRNVRRESKSKATELIHEVTLDDFNIYPIYSVTRKVCTVPDNLDMECCVFVPAPLQHPDTRYVAVAKGAFDEGTERYVYRFFEVAYDGKTILGLPMVAKQSRRMDGSTTAKIESKRNDYVHTFCKTQQMARQLAVQFNRRLYGNPQQIPIDTPRVSFLDCSIYEVFDPHSGRQFNLLVENMMDHTKWFKWNSNNGWRDDAIAREPKQTVRGRPSLGLIHEVDEDIMIDDDESNIMAPDTVANTIRQKPYVPSQVAQAFSHFTHWFTNGMYLVCDLQGIHNMERNALQLSDPVIHSIANQSHRGFVNPYWNHHGTGEYDESGCRTNQFGRTDRGDRGIDDFFMTHRCKDQEQLCQLVTGCEFLRSFE